MRQETDEDEANDESGKAITKNRRSYDAENDARVIVFLRIDGTRSNTVSSDIKNPNKRKLVVALKIRTGRRFGAD